MQHEYVENFVLIFLLFSNSVAKFSQLFVFPDFFHCSKDLVGNLLSFLSPNRKGLRFFTLLCPFLLFYTIFLTECCAVASNKLHWHTSYIIQLFAYTVKKNVSDFPVPSRDVTYQTLPGLEKFYYSRPGRVWKVTSRQRTGNPLSFFYSVLNMPLFSASVSWW